MIEATYKKGDRVRHPARPEWGIGSVTKIEVVTRDSTTDLRVWVRFPSVGEKTMLASVAGLETIDEQGFGSGIHTRPTVTDIDLAKGGGWLGAVSKQSADNIMTALPGEATDPFASHRKRFEFSTQLYRFDGSAARLVEWSVAQSGLDDPMARFNRQELEQLYKRFIFNLDAHVLKLLGELRREKPVIDQVLLTAPPLAVRTVRRLQGMLR
ncbi:MAG: DUF3553 domain-containing protein [Phycisphaerales bacterium]|nr:DUF3553 domain-containing protein [Phycisphaerales bacterium]